jgi:tetratricopeptide (TPR) repeat protein
MSRPELNSHAPSLMTESVPSLLSTRKPEEVKIDAGMGAFDYKKEIEKMSSSAQAGGASLQLDLTVPLPRLASDLDVGGLLLGQAREHVKQKEFKQALTKLESLLGQEPDHSEARFLRALCLCNLDETSDGLSGLIHALEALPAPATRMDAQLIGRIDSLRHAIRTRVFLQFPACMMTMEHQRLAAQVDRLLALDPEGGVLYALRALLLLEQDRKMDAYDMVEAGIRAAAGDVPPMLASLRAGLAGEVLYQCLSPAIDEYKKGRYEQARKTMGKVDARFTGSREYTLFAAHLKRAGGGGLFGFLSSKKSPEQLTFAGPDEDRWLLQGLIVRQEIASARALLEQDEERAAEAAARQALALAPEFPLACYFAAGCGFRRVNSMIGKGAIDIDEILADLGRYHRLAQGATQDPQIASAKNLQEQIAAALAFFTGLQAHIERQRREARLVNGIIQEFVSIMESAKEGIDSIEALREVHGRMTRLRARGMRGAQPGRRRSRRESQGPGCHQ